MSPETGAAPLDKGAATQTKSLDSPKVPKVTDTGKAPYVPEDVTQTAAQWAKVPGQATDLSLPLLKLLVAYSKFAGGQTRVAVVSEGTLATNLGWFYTARKTGERHPHRRKVWAMRKELIELGYMLPAGKRSIHGKWLDAFVVAPYTEGHVSLAQKWQLQTYVQRTLTQSGAPSGDVVVHPISMSGAPSEGVVVHPHKVHIQKGSEVSSELFQSEDDDASPSASRLASQDQKQERTEEEKHESKPKTPLRPPCPGCARAWWQGHEADCPTRGHA